MCQRVFFVCPVSLAFYCYKTNTYELSTEGSVDALLLGLKLLVIREGQKPG